MNFNTDLSLWQSLRVSRANTKESAPLVVDDGMVGCKGEALGRFTSTQDAERTLADAGFVRCNDPASDASLWE